jgi:hypothetical protein
VARQAKAVKVANTVEAANTADTANMAKPAMPERPARPARTAWRPRAARFARALALFAAFCAALLAAYWPRDAQGAGAQAAASGAQGAGAQGAPGGAYVRRIGTVTLGADGAFEGVDDPYQGLPRWPAAQPPEGDGSEEAK